MADSNPTQEFEATVEVAGGRWFVALPFDPDAVWGSKARHHITGTVNGVKIRGPLDFQNGVPALVLPPAWRRDTPVERGQPVTVTLSPEGPQAEALPEDIAAALEASPQARAFFASLATFYRKAYLTWLAGSARRPEVRRERLAQFISLLEAGKKERPR